MNLFILYRASAVHWTTRFPCVKPAVSQTWHRIEAMSTEHWKSRIFKCSWPNAFSRHVQCANMKAIVSTKCQSCDYPLLSQLTQSLFLLISPFFFSPLTFIHFHLSDFIYYFLFFCSVGVCRFI